MPSLSTLAMRHNKTLQQLLVQARFSALANGLAQLRIQRDKLQGVT